MRRLVLSKWLNREDSEKREDSRRKGQIGQTNWSQKALDPQKWPLKFSALHKTIININLIIGNDNG